MRSLVIFGILQLLKSVVSSTSTCNDGNWKLPKDFMIGVATSAYQVEGAWDDSDKGEGTWDRLTHTQPWRTKDANADIACDSFHKYKEDVQLLKDLGVDHYRFSLSWPRILPNGTPDKVSATGVQYYNNLIDEILANGIVPFVTIFHFDDVQLLYEKTGGWVNEEMIEYFADYARVVFREFGDRVKFWSTFNEPEIFCTIMPFVEEPSPPAYTGRYQCAHNLIKAHARAYHIYDDEFRATQKGKVGLAANSGYYYPKSSDDEIAAEAAFQFETGWIMNPIFSENGGYPDIMVQRIGENSRAEGLEESRLPEFSPFWIDYIKGTSDYFGMIHYTTNLAVSVTLENGTWFDDAGVRYELDPEWPISDNNVAIIPQAIGDVLRKIKDAYGNPPVYILENGLGGERQINDNGRVSYLYSYMKEVLLAIRSGCDVRSYTIWSLMDAFEWMNGYSWLFGLHHTNFNDTERQRTPRLSAHWLGQVMAERRLISPDEI